MGKETKVYDGWRYQDDWIVETFAQEGPKILHHGGYDHMVLAEGGTAGGTWCTTRTRAGI